MLQGLSNQDREKRKEIKDKKREEHVWDGGKGELRALYNWASPAYRY